jgi:hypothetical protein
MPPELATLATTSAVVRSMLDCDPGWRPFLYSEARKPYFGRLTSFLAAEESGKQVRCPGCYPCP